MNNDSNLLATILNKIKANKKLQILLVAIIVLISLFVIYSTIGKSDGGEYKESDMVTNYVANLETRLSETLSKVEGAGNVSVVITVNSGMENVLAMKTTTKETTNGVETESSPLLVNGKTVVLKQNYPPIVGVMIVAQGANNIGVLSKLQQATVSLLNISLNQIEILTMK